jgi:uncharacterized protein (DUF952 family)
MSDTAVKVFTADQWAVFVTDGCFAGAPIDIDDGYIHLSAADQLDETIARHFPGVLVSIAHIDLKPYDDAVRWEPSRGGALFPHIYGQSLRLETVIDVEHRTAPI